MKTITVGNDTVGRNTIPISDIDCLHHSIVKKKPVIILHMKEGVKMTIFYWGENARLHDWRTIKKELEGEYFADFDNLVFRPEFVTISKKSQNVDEPPAITIGFQWEFEHVRVFTDFHQMESEYGRLMRILAQSKALLESLKMPYDPKNSEYV